MSDTVLVQVVAGTGNTMTVDVLVPTPTPVAIDVIADGLGAVGYPQLPIELQQLPVSVPVVGKPAINGAVSIPMAMPVNVPANLAGTTVYAAFKANANAIFKVNKVSGLVTTEIGRITFTNVSNTSCPLAGTGGPLAIGDILQVVTPSSVDGNLADIGITLLVNRV